MFYLCFSALTISCIGTIYIFSHIFQGALSAIGHGAPLHPTEYTWVFRLSLNCFGYACIFIPGVLIHKYVRKTKYLERCGNGIFNLKSFYIDIRTIALFRLRFRDWMFSRDCESLFWRIRIGKAAR